MSTAGCWDLPHHVLTTITNWNFLQTIDKKYIFDEISKINGHKWGQMSKRKKTNPVTTNDPPHPVLTAKLQKETFCKKSTKGIYFRIQFDEICKMNGHKWGLISETKKFITRIEVKLLPKYGKRHAMICLWLICGSDVVVSSWAHERLDIMLSALFTDICPWADIGVALPVFTHGQNWRYH